MARHGPNGNFENAIKHCTGDFIHNPAPEGMEQLSSVIGRAGAFLEDIRHLRGNILISTHAIAMKGLLEYLTPESQGRKMFESVGFQQVSEEWYSYYLRV